MPHYVTQEHDIQGQRIVFKFSTTHAFRSFMEEETKLFGEVSDATINNIWIMLGYIEQLYSHDEIAKHKLTFYVNDQDYYTCSNSLFYYFQFKDIEFCVRDNLFAFNETHGVPDIQIDFTVSALVKENRNYYEDGEINIDSRNLLNRKLYRFFQYIKSNRDITRRKAVEAKHLTRDLNLNNSLHDYYHKARFKRLKLTDLSRSIITPTINSDLMISRLNQSGYYLNTMSLNGIITDRLPIPRE